MTRRMIIAALATLAALTLALGVPRLYGTGCDARPFGFALAREESDFLTHCEHIAPIRR